MHEIHGKVFFQRNPTQQNTNHLFCSVSSSSVICWNKRGQPLSELVRRGVAHGDGWSAWSALEWSRWGTGHPQGLWVALQMGRHPAAHRQHGTPSGSGPSQVPGQSQLCESSQEQCWVLHVTLGHAKAGSPHQPEKLSKSLLVKDKVLWETGEQELLLLQGVFLYQHLFHLHLQPNVQLWRAKSMGWLPPIRSGCLGLHPTQPRAPPGMGYLHTAIKFHKHGRICEQAPQRCPASPSQSAINSKVVQRGWMVTGRRSQVTAVHTQPHCRRVARAEQRRTKFSPPYPGHPWVSQWLWPPQEQLLHLSGSLSPPSLLPPAGSSHIFRFLKEKNIKK